MGKTPERVNAAAPVMRYRRKVPTTAAAVPSVDEKHEDNQMEHREAEPVVEDERKIASKGLHQALKQKPLNPTGPARKKKLKADAQAKEKLATATPAEDKTSDAVVTKKKLKKRQLPGNNANDEKGIVAEQHPIEPEAEAEKPKPTIHQSSKRKNKNENHNSKHKGASLLKQLLWKAKPVALPVLPEGSSDSAPVAVSPVVTATQQITAQPTEEDQDEEEEVAYTASERHNRKLQASQVLSSDLCGATTIVSGELSSQETQPGSDDEETATAFLSAYENLVPVGAIEPQDLSLPTHVNSFYPTPFPLGLVSDVALLKKHGITVHELLIEDFAFHPQQLRIQPGDVVVWKVSGQTLGMVEHSLEASLMMPRESKSKKPKFVKATAPPLGSGSSFAWRFETTARVHIQCSVYQTKGIVLIGNLKAKKDKKPPIETVVQEPAAVPAPVTNKPVSKTRKSKEKLARCKQAAAEARAAAAAHEAENDRTMESDVVFHPPQNLARSAEMDAGVCRAVLTQLEEVAAAARAADVIVIGDVECPVLADGTTDQTVSENPADHDAVHVQPDEKPSTLADEWSGTEEDDDEDEDVRPSSDAEENEIEDFQQRIIGMLKRSEETRAQHRLSFQQEQSGFDAGAAYDFFKQRFMRVQEERQIVYALCPEPQSGCGVGLTDVVNLLSGSAA